MNSNKPSYFAGEKGYDKIFWFSVAFSIAAGLLIVILVLVYIFAYQNRIGPAQPISFSHRIHTTEKKINCVFCHSGAIDTDVAGIPPLQTCMLCHENIIIHHPEIAKLRDNFYKKIPVEWNRVIVLQEFVFFSHQTHIQSGIDCGKCHGNVAKMDRVIMKREFQMGFCVQCHRDTKVSHDCLMCHR